MHASRLCLGVIAGAHGLRGAVRVKTFTAAPEAIADYGPLKDAADARRFALRLIRVEKGVALVHIKGVGDRNGAEALKGVELFLDRGALPPAEDEEEFYHADLVGLAAVDTNGNRLGTVRALHDFGAGDLIEVLPDEGGQPRVFPFTRETVPDIDLAAGAVTIDPPEGL
ncbi:MAG: ribosome maturation factor RimM [Alphaproteobacteria bacterium]|nr:ribosome maturation factor RimM [Alphaproteobacteria bacterium]